jgi:hypothetical protein
MKTSTIKVNQEEAEMINKALKFIAKKYVKESEEAEDISTCIMFEKFAREYNELANKFPY